jgi:hypothetical protein
LKRRLPAGSQPALLQSHSFITWRVVGLYDDGAGTGGGGGGEVVWVIYKYCELLQRARTPTEKRGAGGGEEILKTERGRMLALKTHPSCVR